ncbi:Very-long-chain 3-oxoacyl-coa reductase [Globisporangium polare]
MAYDNHKSLTSVLCHPAFLGVGIALLALILLPALAVAWIFRALFILQFAFVILDIALTKYHLWTFKATVPQPKRYALVTGASSGIGREIAYELAKQGYSLIIASRTLKNLETVRSDIEKIYEPVQVLVCACDLSKSEGIDTLLAFVADNKLVVDILVNNAGASFSGDFVDASPAAIEEMLTLDVLSVVKLLRGIAPQMVTRGVGRILNVGSMSASVCLPGAALYGSSKAFLLNFSQSVNYELRGTGVTVTCILPGPVKTNFSAAADCEQATFMNSGGVLDAHTCAKLSLAAMFNADGYGYDTFTSYFGATLMRCYTPARIGLWMGATSWSAPSKKWQLLRR